jgi:hypothetical protein
MQDDVQEGACVAGLQKAELERETKKWNTRLFKKKSEKEYGLLLELLIVVAMFHKRRSVQGGRHRIFKNYVAD